MRSDRALSHQELWRPSEQVLHLLERNHEPGVWVAEEKQSMESDTPGCGGDEQPVMKRQAPTVWRPPVAMKPNYAPAAPVDEWQLPEEQPKLLDPFTFLGGGDHRHEEHTQPREEALQADEQHHSEDSRFNNAAREDESYENEDEDEDGEHTPRDFPGENEGQELMPPPRSREGSTLGSFMASSPSSNFHHRMVPQTPLFSGLGSVTFSSGGGFSVPTSASIFGQNPTFGLGGSTFATEVDEPGEKRPPEQAQPSPSNRFTRSQANNRFQRLNSAVSLSEKGTSLSEKGSSDSLAGNNTTKVVDVQSEKTGNGGGFKPSGLAGKSFVSPGDVKDVGVPPVPGKKNGRKLRTRPMDLLMNAIKVTDPKAKSGTGSAAQVVPQARSGVKTRSCGVNKNDNSTNNNGGKNKKSSNEENGSGDGGKRGAYFVHTGAWIVQRKSSRTARNAFKREVEEEEEEEEPPSSNANLNVKGKQGAVGNGHGGSGRHVTKKRSLTAMSQQPESAQQMKGGSVEDENGENKVGVVRSKRGRCQVLPIRFQDSDFNPKIGKAKKNTRK